MGEDVFVDKYIQNHDARVLENNGETKLMYSFADRKYLIITNNEEALAEIFKKSPPPIISTQKRNGNMANSKEAKARIKINKLLEQAGWRFFDNEKGQANISLSQM